MLDVGIVAYVIVNYISKKYLRVYYHTRTNFASTTFDKFTQKRYSIPNAAPLIVGSKYGTREVKHNGRIYHRFWHWSGSQCRWNLHLSQVFLSSRILTPSSD